MKPRRISIQEWKKMVGWDTARHHNTTLLKENKDYIWLPFYEFDERFPEITKGIEAELEANEPIFIFRDGYIGTDPALGHRPDLFAGWKLFDNWEKEVRQKMVAIVAHHTKDDLRGTNGDFHYSLRMGEKGYGTEAYSVHVWSNSLSATEAVAEAFNDVLQEAERRGLFIVSFVERRPSAID